MKTTEERIKALEAELQKLKQDIKPKFEVGKWYTYLNAICCYTGNNEGYGFHAYGEWATDIKISIPEIWIPATESEVFEALKKEAIKRGFKEGATIISYLPSYGYNDKRKYTLNNCGASYEKHNNALRMGGSAIFHNGKWAEIIKDEPIKIGGYEVKKNENGSYDIGCKKQISNGKVKVLRRLMIQCNFKTVSFDGIGTDLETINKILCL